MRRSIMSCQFIPARQPEGAHCDDYLQLRKDANIRIPKQYYYQKQHEIEDAKEPQDAPDMDNYFSFHAATEKDEPAN